MSEAKVISKFLKNVFDIREGEILRASLMQLNIFLIISTLLIVKPTVNGLFLSKFGVESLPYAFILVAIVAAVVSTLYSRALSKIPLNKIIDGTLYFSIFSLIFFGIFLRLNFLEGWILYLFYIWVAIFALLATSQFWVLANIVFNAREAKRLFGFIGAGAIAGGIFGGYLTSVLAQFMSSENLPFVCAALLVCCIPVNKYIWKKTVIEIQTPFQQRKRAKGFGDHPANLVLQSKHLTYLASIVGVSAIIAKLVDYQFGGVASALISDPDELTAFFGFWFSTFNVISLLVQLVVTRKVVGTYGVGSSLLFLPASILLAVILLLIFPELLFAAIFLKMSDSGLKQSVNKAAMELMILPVPVNIKNQTKTFIDVFVDSLATGISGLILIFLVKGLDLSTTAISLMIVVMLMVWFYLIYFVKKEYLRSFRLRLDENIAPDAKKPIGLSDKSVLDGLKKVLENGSEKQLLYVLNKVRGKAHEQLFESIFNLLDNPSEMVIAEAIHNLYFYKKPGVSEKIESLTHHSSQKIKVAAFEYLIAHTTENRIELMDNYLKQADNNAALISIASETHDNPQLRSLFNLESRIQKGLEKLPLIEDPEEKKNLTIILLKTIGKANIPEFFPALYPFFESEDSDIAKNAILAAGETLSQQFISPLVRLLYVPALQESTQIALVNYGKEIVTVLQRMVNDGEMSLEATRMIPSVVKQFGTQNAVNFLFELFDHDDLMVRQEALRGLNLLRNNYPHLKFSKKDVVHRILNETNLYQDTLSILYLQVKIDSDNSTPEDSETIEARKGLTRLLEKRLDKNLERIFRLLGLNYPNEDIFIIYKGIHSQKPDMRTNALEFLDNLLEPSLKKVLIPLVETSMLEAITEDAIKNLNIKIPEEYQCFRLLLNGNDNRLKLAVLYLLEQLKDKQFLPLVQEHKNSNNSKVRLFAINAENSIISG